MIRFLSRRLLVAVVTVLVCSFVVFLAIYLAPGSPLTALTGGRALPPATIASLKDQYHLDDPFMLRYVHWLGAVAHGDFGQSLQFRQDVGSILGPRAQTTVFLVGYAALLTAVFGILLGALAALRKGALETTIVAGTAAALATPAFVTATALIYLFGVELHWLPTIGAGAGFSSRLSHLTLPAIALAIGNAAYVARFTRAALNAELVNEHVVTARSRGIPERLVLRRHVFRNAMVPLTTLVGISVAGLVATDVVVEQAFSVPGLGSALVGAVLGKDFAVVQAILLLFVVTFVVINTLADVLHGYLDPRIGFGGRR